MLQWLAAAPRPAGGANEARVRARCGEILRSLGFSVAEEPFSYSTLPGRFATPLAGAASMGLLGAAGYVASKGGAVEALALLAVGGGGVGAIALWSARRGVLDIPWGRAEGLNLVARRHAGDGHPPFWLVAHLDSKSQPVPIVVRAIGIVATIAAWVLALALASAQAAGAGVAGAWAWVALAGAVAGLPVAASFVGSRSAGALDNASGVATVLLAAGELPRDRPVGVLLTSAEELGLAGARAWVRGAPPRTAVNVDGVDDGGRLRFTYTRGRPRTVLSALHGGAERLGVPTAEGRLLPGVLLDGVALADAGWAAVTVSKGTLSTVWRIHTSRDTVDSVQALGIAQAAGVVALALKDLTSP